MVDEGECAGLPDAALNVAGVYARLRDDIIGDTRTSPDFDHAVRLTRLVEDLLAASEDGRRRSTDGWPRQGDSPEHLDSAAAMASADRSPPA